MWTRALRIDEELGEPVFYCRDNGNGMDAPGLSHMFRQGHKREAFNRKKLGKYGVGFKSGSMRIGRNAVVFTRKGDTGSIGLLSQVGSRRRNVRECMPDGFTSNTL